jgi:hypothetical protein
MSAYFPEYVENLIFLTFKHSLSLGHPQGGIMLVRRFMKLVGNRGAHRPQVMFVF